MCDKIFVWKTYVSIVTLTWSNYLVPVPNWAKQISLKLLTSNMKIKVSSPQTTEAMRTNYRNWFYL